MQETLEKILFYARSIWRYRWYAMVAAWLIILLGWVVISKKTITYTASAKVFVDTSTILKPMLQGFAINQDKSVIVGLMARQLISRTNLEQVAHIVGLNHQAKTPQEFDTFLTRLGEDIRVEGSQTSAPERQVNFYGISYSNKDPKFAKQVVEALITTFVEKTVGESLRDSEAARQFLDQQLKEYRETLMAAEARVREFQREHSDELPEQSNYVQRLQAAQAALNDVDLQIAEAEIQRNELQRQLAQTAITSDSASTADPRLLELQRRLDELLLKYTENHPLVIATRQAIAEFEKQQEAMPKEKRNLIIPNSAHEQLKVRLSEAETALVVLRVKKDEYLRRLKKLQQTKEKLTKIEIELQRLNQDYEAAKRNYEALLGRRDSATITGNIEQSGESVRFKVIDPPRILDTWSIKARDQLVLTSAVLAAGLAGGVGVAFLLTQLWPVIYGRRILQEVTEYPVLGVISQTMTRSLRRRGRFDLAAFILSGVMLLGAHGVAVFMILSNIKTIMMQGLEGAG